MYTFIIILGMFFLVVVGLKLLEGGLKKCQNCGNRLTILQEEQTPDNSYGWEISHLRVERHCIHCGHVEVVRGITVTTSTEK